MKTIVPPHITTRLQGMRHRLLWRLALIAWCALIGNSAGADTRVSTKTMRVSVVIPSRVEAFVTASSNTVGGGDFSFCVSGNRGSLYSIYTTPTRNTATDATESRMTAVKSTSEPSPSCDLRARTHAWQAAVATRRVVTLVIVAE